MKMDSPLCFDFNKSVRFNILIDKMHWYNKCFLSFVSIIVCWFATVDYAIIYHIVKMLYILFLWTKFKCIFFTFFHFSKMSVSYFIAEFKKQFKSKHGSYLNSITYHKYFFFVYDRFVYFHFDFKEYRYFIQATIYYWQRYSS